MTTKENTMTPTFETLDDFRTYLDNIQDDRDHAAAGGPSFRAERAESAVEPVADAVEEWGECAHPVLTSEETPALTSSNASAPVSQSEGAEEREEQRTPDAPPYRTDPDQPRSDLLKRTRSSLATEVRRLRWECAKLRRKLRDAEERLSAQQEARHG